MRRAEVERLRRLLLRLSCNDRPAFDALVRLVSAPVVVDAPRAKVRTLSPRRVYKE